VSWWRREAQRSAGSATTPTRHASRIHFEGTDNAVLEAYRELIEQVASDAYDADASVDGRCVVVSKEVLNQVGRGD
jgi:hypothetical protein